MAKSMTVHRKGYRRKAYTAKRGGKKVRVGRATVKPSTFKVSDRGKRGRGPKVVPPLEKGALGGPGFFNRPRDEQKQIVFRRAKKMGEKKGSGRTARIAGILQNNRPAKVKARAGIEQVAGSFKGKQKVGYPEGYRRKQ